LAEKLEQLAASDAVPSPTLRVQRKLPGGLVPQAIMQVLAQAVEPMRVRDIHDAVEDLLDRSVPTSTVKSFLATNAQADGTRLVRLGHGRYRLIAS
jgi:hypothetical protein